MRICFSVSGESEVHDRQGVRRRGASLGPSDEPYTVGTRQIDHQPPILYK